VDFAELKTEFARRGFDYIDATTAGRWINQAYAEICAHRRWPFLEANTAGNSPLSISDLGAIQTVRITSGSTVLHHEYKHTLLDKGESLAQAGTPTRYYLNTGNEINVHPADVTAISVHYWKVPAVLTGTDTPLIPLRYHNLIVDGAVRRAYLDTDNFEAAAAVESERQNGLKLMERDLLNIVDREPDREETGQP
jgi:hypothetical protein